MRRPLTESSGLCDRQPRQSAQLLEHSPPGNPTRVEQRPQGEPGRGRPPLGFCPLKRLLRIPAIAVTIASGARFKWSNPAGRNELEAEEQTRSPASYLQSDMCRKIITAYDIYAARETRAGGRARAFDWFGFPKNQTCCLFDLFLSLMKFH